MDYGKSAYLLVEELGERFSSRNLRRTFFRRTACAGVSATDPFVVRGRGKADVRMFAPDGRFTALSVGGKRIRCPAVRALAFSVQATRAGITVQAEAEHASELFVFAEGGASGRTEQERGVSFETADGLCAGQGALYLARGGKVLGLDRTLTVQSSRPQFGKFGVAAGRFYWLCEEGLFACAQSETGRGESVAANAVAFAVSESRLCWLADGKVFEATPENPVPTASTSAPDAENLRFAGETLLLERAGASWQKTQSGWARFCSGTGACKRGETVYASRAGVIYAGETPVALGEEAVVSEGKVFVRCGSDVYELEENL